MKNSSRLTVFLFILASALFGPILQKSYAQDVCTVSIRMVNHNRYAYDTDEECPWAPVIEHSVPFGNWGVSSNVGSKQDADQFQGWYPTGGHIEWNSCAVGYVRPDPNCQRLNFPLAPAGFPFPANGYPFTDVYSHNNCAASGCNCVDQYSPQGKNDYGGTVISSSVNAPFDSDCDGIVDAGGCRDLNGLTITIRNNFMTVYELDNPDEDDLVQSLYFPDMSVTLTCTRNNCFAVGDSNRDGWFDDVNNQFSSAYKWPTAYYDEFNQLRKRIDATARIGYVRGSYSGRSFACNPACDPLCTNEPPCDPVTQICN